MAFYGTPVDLRSRLGVDIPQLSDAEATRLLTVASDAIDNQLSTRLADSTTGRRVVMSDPLVASWQWAKLGDAAIEYAVVEYRAGQAILDPSSVFDSVKGPDFAFSGRIDAASPASADPMRAAMVALLASGLVIRFATGRATP